MEENEIVAKAMSILGSRTSPKKAAASRKNGSAKKRKKLTDSKTNANNPEIVSTAENKV